MRTIKFRALDFNNEWKYGYYTYDSIQNKHFINTQEVKGDTVSQYTSLHDKNGKEIYEGDVVLEWRTEFNEQKLKHEPVRPGSEKWVVKYNNGGYYPFAVAFWECTEDAEHCEVIGNIWENPELLKGVEI